MDYRYGSHPVYRIEYHFVWVTKYRYKVLIGDNASRVRELVRQTCEAFEIQIVKGVVSRDHVHIVGELSAGDGTVGDHEATEGAYLEQAV